jgi:hypothetical protein
MILKKGLHLIVKYKILAIIYRFLVNRILIKKHFRICDIISTFTALNEFEK